LDDREIAALGVGIVALDVAAEDEAAFVGLADIEMAGTEGHHDGDYGLHAFGDESLDGMALDGKPQAGKRGDPRRVAGAGERDLLRGDIALLGLAAYDAAVLDTEAGRRAILDDVDATGIGAARIAPGHRIMAHRAAARLPQSAADWEACIVEIDEGNELLDLVAVEQLGIDAVQPHGVAAPRV